MDTTTLIGFFAAVCTSVSYLPQFKKCWDTGKAEDLSLLMFSIIVANALSLCCLAGILWFKLRESPAPFKRAGFCSPPEPRSNFRLFRTG